MDSNSVELSQAATVLLAPRTACNILSHSGLDAGLPATAAGGLGAASLAGASARAGAGARLVGLGTVGVGAVSGRAYCSRTADGLPAATGFGFASGVGWALR